MHMLSVYVCRKRVNMHGRFLANVSRLGCMREGSAPPLLNH